MKVAEDSVQVVDDMPHEVYHADPAPEPSLSSSIAKILINQSPLHAWHAHPRLNGDHVSRENGDFDRGSAAHSLLLEGEDRMVVCPFDDWRKNAAKDMRDAARAAGKLPLLEKHADGVRTMVGIAKIALRESELELAIKDCFVERTIIWRDGDIWKRARFDLQHRTRPLVLDYKSTESADPFAFPGLMVSLGYDVQAAHYTEAYLAAHPKAVDTPMFVFLVQERSEPFACSLVGVDPMMFDLGHQKMRIASGLWRQCIRAGEWPGYSKRIAWASPPTWALNKFVERAA